MIANDRDHTYKNSLYCREKVFSQNRKQMWVFLNEKFNNVRVSCQLHDALEWFTFKHPHLKISCYRIFSNLALRWVCMQIKIIYRKSYPAAFLRENSHAMAPNSPRYLKHSAFHNIFNMAEKRELCCKQVATGYKGSLLTIRRICNSG